MTPNLTRLFDVAERRIVPSSDYLIAAEARYTANLLLIEYGEALIEALELGVRALRVGDVDALPVMESLLARLEQEAHGRQV